MTEHAIAYVPVLHEGYRRFVQAHAAGRPLHLIGPELYVDFRPLAKDVRALDAQLAAQAVAAWGICSEVSVLTAAGAERLAAEQPRLTLPDEDVSHQVVERFFARCEVRYDTVFLRWDKTRTVQLLRPAARSAEAGELEALAEAAAGLMNSRFLPMNIAFAPSLRGGALKRAAQGQAVVDSSWALAARGDGTFDRWYLFGATAVQYLTWSTGTVVGVLGGDVIGDTEKLGLDAVYPTFFLALLIAELRDGRAKGAAAFGAVVALALVPVAPPGIPILAASLGALIGLWRREDA